jgi:hypothetical protein
MAISKELKYISLPHIEQKFNRNHFFITFLLKPGTFIWVAWSVDYDVHLRRRTAVALIDLK